MERCICIHGHFYQPPRENAWLEYVEWQDSAYPYHDWNEKITAECYLPNASSRLLDRDGNITRIVSNYARISFDFGPTLLAWLEAANPDVYHAVIEADRESRQNFSGHGSALAQAYSHLIMPLANRRDKYSQVLWGIRDFEHRFGRPPGGMWLPETAVDLETLDIMAELGISFTILAPHQARRARRTGAASWKDVSGASIDPTRPYLARLPSGRQISIFFYDGPISNAIAFEDVLKNGEVLAGRLTGAFSARKDGPQLVSVATDGETYGHHHRFTDMALAFALDYIEKNNLAKITNYGEYLENHPPAHEVEIIEKTSWSCPHGIDRWWSDDGCKTGAGDPGWNQQWRTPLRNAMDWLRDDMAPKYEARARRLFKDPWAARDGYIEVILDRSAGSVDGFFGKHAVRELNEAEKVTALKLLELQRHAMLMYTSCGWFFDEISRPEPVQVIEYAARVVQLAGELFGDDAEGKFLDILAQAKSNIPAQGDGRRIYEDLVRPAVVDLTRVAAHYAVSSLFEDYNEISEVFCYTVENKDYRTTECGQSRLVTGLARLASEITQESALLAFGVLCRRGHIINAGVRAFPGDGPYQEMVSELAAACASADITDVVHLLDKYFGGAAYSLKSLFRDEQRKVLGYILESALAGIGTAYRQLYEHYYSPMRVQAELGGPVPRAFHAAAELIIDIDLRRAVTAETVDAGAVHNLVETARSWQVELDGEGIGHDFKRNLEKMMAALAARPENIESVKNVLAAVRLARGLPFPVDLWKVQNLYWGMLQDVYPAFKAKAAGQERAAVEWLEAFTALGRQLSIRVG
jgi:alpha-amylase/alpha-mannosidase (GH57 family)